MKNLLYYVFVVFLVVACTSVPSEKNLRKALENKDYEKLESIFEKLGDLSIKPSNYNQIPLRIILKSQDSNVHELAYAYGADPFATSYFFNDLITHIKDKKIIFKYFDRYKDHKKENDVALNFLDYILHNDRNDLLQEYITRGYSLNIYTEYGMSPLHIAAYHKLQSVEIFNTLIDSMDIDIKNNIEGHTPLYFAIKSENYPIIEILLSRGANLEIAGIDGKSSLDLAIELYNEGIISNIKKMSVEQLTSGEGKSIISRALNYHGFEIIIWAIEKFPVIKNNYPFVTNALKNNWHPSEILYLINECPIVDTDENYSLEFAMVPSGGSCESNYDKEIVLNLLKRGASITDRVLCNLIYTYDPDIIYETLIRISPNRSMFWGKATILGTTRYYSSTPLIVAIENGFYDLANSLIDEGANVRKTARRGDNGEFTALHAAVQKGVLLLVKKIHKKGCDLNARYGSNGSKKLGITPLYYAVEKGDNAIVEYLLEVGANPNIQKYGSLETALHEAVKLKNQEASILLINNGANVFVKDKEGNSSYSVMADSKDFLQSVGKATYFGLKIHNASSTDEIIEIINNPEFLTTAEQLMDDSEKMDNHFKELTELIEAKLEL